MYKLFCLIFVTTLLSTLHAENPHINLIPWKPDPEYTPHKNQIIPSQNVKSIKKNYPQEKKAPNNNSK